MKKTDILFGLTTLGLCLSAQAETAANQPVDMEGGFTAILQTASDSQIDAELTSSFDLVASQSIGSAQWGIHMEGNTTARTDGVSNLLGEANADAGSALDRDGNGRLQVSELFIAQMLSGGQFTVGLLDATGSLDGSGVANDESEQFLSGPLVNNPTIEFPDYSLGMTYSREASEGQVYNLVLLSSHGLADNPNASYSQLVDVDDEDKGVFAAAEGQWPLASTQLHAGLWINTADHARLDGDSDTEHNYGLYLSVDGEVDVNHWNVRAGIANDEVSQASQFLSAAIERPFSSTTLGVGIAYTGLSDEDATPEQDDTLLAEGYLRFTPYENLSVTPIVQWINNSNFDASGDPLDEDQTLFSLRMNYVF